MRGKWLAMGLAGLLGATLALPAAAQEPVSTSMGMVGPTRYFAVPQAQVLDSGIGVVSTGILLNANNPLALGAGSLSLRSQMGMANNFQLDTGIAASSFNPLSGQLNLTGKWGMMRQDQGALASIAGLAGGILSVDVNGNPRLGAVIGLPITANIGIGAVNNLGLSLFPAYNIGYVAPATLLPGGAVPAPANFLSLGVGAQFSLTPNLMLLADSNLGIPGVTGTQTQTNVGVRYAFAPGLVTDLFVGLNPNVAAPALGITAHWGF
ncbi:MAG: hypothetical protein ACM3YO_00845 [Bacteroidota bacterium]